MDAIPNKSQPTVATSSQEAMRSALERMRGGSKYEPYYKQLEFIDRELGRLHMLITAKVQMRESAYDSEQRLTEYQTLHKSTLEELRVISASSGATNV